MDGNFGLFTRDCFDLSRCHRGTAITLRWGMCMITIPGSPVQSLYARTVWSLAQLMGTLTVDGLALKRGLEVRRTCLFSGQSRRFQASSGGGKWLLSASSLVSRLRGDYARVTLRKEVRSCVFTQTLDSVRDQV